MVTGDRAGESRVCILVPRMGVVLWNAGMGIISTRFSYRIRSTIAGSGKFRIGGLA